ncbi:MAG: signal peptidase I [Methylacidiphilales bacterium]|nr:signal peptidase I [Candidatus Methylacidiphilales bacterium]
MFKFFLPRKTKQVLAESELIYVNLQRNRTYAQDTMAARDLETAEGLEARYKALLKTRDVEGLEKLNKEAMKFCNRHFPATAWDGWRENVEVFVVAAIMALAIRTFFLQPFQIPTGSMEPTLFGIEPVLTSAQPPNVLYQIYDFAINGKTYSRVVTDQGGKIVKLTPGTMTMWFDYTDVTLENDRGDQETKRIWIRMYDVETKLGLYEYGTPDPHDQHIHDEVYTPGAVLANYVTQSGDKVLVDKVTYNFRSPQRGDVFIFKTAGIPQLAHERGPDQEGSEDFIKRCVGLAGDLVEVKPPKLYINGSLAAGSPAYEKEFSGQDNYPGYSLVQPWESFGTTQDNNTTQTYYVPVDCYWAMGDNSPNSKDSRYWGGVPRQNLVGRGYFVFWPFTSRWGWIR